MINTNVIRAVYNPIEFYVNLPETREQIEMFQAKMPEYRARMDEEVAKIDRIARR